jgi:excisionase family DNA binding protein
MTEILIVPISVNELKALVETCVKNALSALPSSTAPHSDEFVDVKAAGELLRLAVPTIYSLVCRRELSSYKRGKKLYFKKSELLQWIAGGRRRTNKELRMRGTLS